MLDSWFESDPIKAVLGFDAVVGNLASPYTAGSAYVLLHHAFGEVNGKRGVWGHAIGGMGAITQAMASAAVEHGVRIDVGSEVREVLVEGDRATGVVLKDGTAVRARAVVANVNPQQLFQALVPRDAVPARHGCTNEGVEGRFRDFSYERRAFEAAGFYRTARTWAIITLPALFWRRAFPTWTKPIAIASVPAGAECQSSRWSFRRHLTTASRRRAPTSQAYFVSMLTPQFADGSTWDQHRETVADLMIDTVEAYAPGFKASVIARQSLSPLDLERIFGLPNGDIFHGAMTLDQLFSARPMLGFADYRMPIAGLYLCGSGAHPGGGVTGAPGHNAAQAVIADLLRE